MLETSGNISPIISINDLNIIAASWVISKHLGVAELVRVFEFYSGEQQIVLNYLSNI